MPNVQNATKETNGETKQTIVTDNAWCRSGSDAIPRFEGYDAKENEGDQVERRKEVRIKETWKRLLRRNMDLINNVNCVGILQMNEDLTENARA